MPRTNSLLKDGTPRRGPYQEGWRSFLDGKPADCPESVKRSRVDWYSGYYAARVQSRLGHIFKKWGVSDGTDK